MAGQNDSPGGFSKARVTFSAVPNRAIGDARLTDGEFRILTAILSYDRLSGVRKKGQGAWASHRTMAARLRVNYTHFSATVSKLLKLGYLIRERRATNGTQYTYRGVYNDDDWKAYRHEDFAGGQTDSSMGVFREANARTETVCRDGQLHVGTVCQADGLKYRNEKESADQYISQREGIDSDEPGEKNSVETAQLALKAFVEETDWLRFGGRLAALERASKKYPESLDRANLHKARDILWRILAVGETDDPLTHQAQRLLEKFEDSDHE